MHRMMLDSRLFRVGLIALGLGLGACNGAGEAPAAPAHAQAALAQLTTVVSQENFERLGFTDLGDVSNATVDDAVPVYMVRLDQLRRFEPGSDANKLLVDLDTAFYPVRVRGEVRSSMELHRENGAWQAHSYGNVAHAQIVSRVRQQAAQAAGVAPGAMFEVRVLALNIYFLGHQGARGLMLTPMLDQPELGLKAGTPQPAADVFARLRPLALAHDGQPT